jgi:hypothetical protein
MLGVLLAIGGIGILLSVLCRVFSASAPSMPNRNRFSVGDEPAGASLGFDFEWVIVLDCILINGPWYDLGSMWVAPWLEGAFGYSSQATTTRRSPSRSD